LLTEKIMPDSPMPQPSSPDSEITAPRRSTALRVLKRLLAVFVIAGIGVWGLHWYATGGAGKKDSSAKTNEASVPVDVAAAQQEDFPVYLNGLGVVQGWNTVTIRARVDGQIDKIAFKEGQMVKQGDLLLEIDPRPFQAILDQAIAKKALDEALLANSKRDLERYRTVGTLAVSQQQIDTQAALVKQQEAQINSDQGAIDNAQVQLSYTTITAPIAGRMGFRMVDRGNIVHASDQQGVAIITQVQPIAVIFTAPEDDLPRITAGVQAGPLPVTALTSDGKTELDRGTLALIDNQVDTATGSIRLKAKFDNTDTKLWPGLTVATRLQIETLKDAVVVPDLAVQRGPNGLFVYVVGDDNKVEMRKAEVDVIQDGKAVVKGGIAAGQRVVTSGSYRLQPGTPVEIRHGEEPNSIAGKRSAASPAAVQVE
jgi:membrane fusion protein, multidrug efflux system